MVWMGTIAVDYVTDLTLLAALLKWLTYIYIELSLLKIVYDTDSMVSVVLGCARGNDMIIQVSVLWDSSMGLPKTS